MEPAALAAAVRIGEATAVAIFDGAAVELTPTQRERLVFVVNILRRLEVRLLGDDGAMRAALRTPHPGLGGSTPLAAMAGDISALRHVRQAVVGLSTPTVRYWRVGHN